jgi:hypothetical protein
MILKRHSSESVEVSEIEVSVPYLRVVSSLSKKESLEKIVASGGGVLVSSEWEEFKFDLKRIPRISSWQVRAKGKLVVRSQSEDFSGQISIIQDVKGDKQGIFAHSYMDGQSGFLKVFSSEINVIKGDNTIIKVKTRIVYERVIPFWMCDEVDNLVKEHNKSRLDSTMSVIKYLIYE